MTAKKVVLIDRYALTYLGGKAVVVDFGGEPISVAYCWVHARRKLKEVLDRDGSEIAPEGLRRIAEKDIRGTSHGQRLSARQAQSAHLVAAAGDWLQAQRMSINGAPAHDLAHEGTDCRAGGPCSFPGGYRIAPILRGKTIQAHHRVHASPAERCQNWAAYRGIPPALSGQNPPDPSTPKPNSPGDP